MRGEKRAERCMYETSVGTIRVVAWFYYAHQWGWAGCRDMAMLVAASSAMLYASCLISLWLLCGE